MHKSLVGLAAAAGIGLASLAAPAPANAGCFGCAVGVGVLGGVAAGAIIGSAIANSPPPGYYPPPPGYYPPPPPGATARRRRLPMARHPVPVMRSSRPAVTGRSAGFGSKALATGCGLSRPVSKLVRS